MLEKTENTEDTFNDCIPLYKNLKNRLYTFQLSACLSKQNDVVKTLPRRHVFVTLWSDLATTSLCRFPKTSRWRCEMTLWNDLPKHQTRPSSNHYTTNRWPPHNLSGTFQQPQHNLLYIFQQLLHDHPPSIHLYPFNSFIWECELHETFNAIWIFYFNEIVHKSIDVFVSCGQVSDSLISICFVWRQW